MSKFYRRPVFLIIHSDVQMHNGLFQFFINPMWINVFTACWLDLRKYVLHGGWEQKGETDLLWLVGEIISRYYTQLTLSSAYTLSEYLIFISIPSSSLHQACSSHTHRKFKPPTPISFSKICPYNLVLMCFIGDVKLVSGENFKEVWGTWNHMCFCIKTALPSILSPLI